MDGVKRSALEVIGQRNVNMAKIRQIFPSIPSFGSALDKQVEIDASLFRLSCRQSNDIEAFKKDEAVIIPIGINYDELKWSF